MPILFGIFILVTSGLIQASESAHAGGSIKELLFPVLNFGVLFIFIFIKARKPMATMFAKNAEEVRSQFSHAMGKDKQAQIKLDMYNKKMNSLESDMKKIANEAITDSENYSTKQAKETQLTIVKRKSDAVVKVTVEREVMVQSINEDLVDEVIKRTKKSIKEKSDIQQKVTNKLLASL